MNENIVVALRELIAKWRRSAAWEFDSGIRQFAKGRDQCADDLDALARIEPPTSGLCRDCVHLRPFELAHELNICPVVNIRIHTESAAIFGCNQFEARHGRPPSAEPLTQEPTHGEGK